MLTLDVCLESVFTDLPAEQRIEHIAEAGYQAVECWFHDATFDGNACVERMPKNAAAIHEACRATGVRVNNMVVNAPDGSFGGSPVRKEDRARYLERVEEVIAFAKSIDCHKAITCSGNAVEGRSRAEQHACLQEAYGAAATIAARHQFTLLVEPLNTHVDHAGYFLDSSTEAAEIVRAVASPHLRLLYDVYHMQIMEGNVLATIERQIDIIGHFHSAAVPGRGELQHGELNYPWILQRIEALGYTGCFGLEYFPQQNDHLASLRSVREALTRA